MNNRTSREGTYWDHTYQQVGIKDDTITIFPTCIDHYRLTTKHFYSLLRDINTKKVLSVGGGIDRFAIYLAKNNNQVTSIDISAEAGKGTILLAKKNHVESRMKTLTLSCDEMDFNEDFDVVISHHALHHMNFMQALTKISKSLVKGGIFIAEEPICLAKIIQFIHKKLPFHPEPFCFSEDEFELTRKELSHIEKYFSNVEFYFADLLTRESIMYLIYKMRLKRILPLIGKVDAVVMKIFPFLRKFASYVIIKGVKL